MIVSTLDSRARLNRPISVATASPYSGGAVVSLATVRRHCAVSLTDDDDILQMYIESASDTVASIIGYPLLSTERVATFDVLTARLYLTEPASNVVSISVTDVDGHVETVDPAAYIVETASRPARITLHPDHTWTALAACDVRSLSVCYTCGWTPQTTPPAVLHAVIVLVAQMYEQRQATSPHVQHEVPYGVRALLQPHILPRWLA